MTLKNLSEEISIELELLASVLNEIYSLRDDLMYREPTVREKTAQALFWRNFTAGLKTSLKG